MLSCIESYTRLHAGWILLNDGARKFSWSLGDEWGLLRWRALAHQGLVTSTHLPSDPFMQHAKPTLGTEYRPVGRRGSTHSCQAHWWFFAANSSREMVGTHVPILALSPPRIPMYSIVWRHKSSCMFCDMEILNSTFESSYLSVVSVHISSWSAHAPWLHIPGGDRCPHSDWSMTHFVIGNAACLRAIIQLHTSLLIKSISSSFENSTRSNGDKAGDGHCCSRGESVEIGSLLQGHLRSYWLSQDRNS